LRIIHINYFDPVRSDHGQGFIISPKVDSFVRKDQNQKYKRRYRLTYGKLKFSHDN